MDTTNSPSPMDGTTGPAADPVLDDLRGADPAEAPDLAEAIAAELAADLESPGEDRP